MITDSLLEFVRNEKNADMDFVRRARTRGEGVYLYGAGHHLRFAVRFMRQFHIPVKAILDSNRQGEYQGIPIVLFADFLASEPNSDSWFVISAPSAAEEITEILAKHFPRENIFSPEMFFYLDYVPDMEEYRSYLIGHWEEFKRFAEALSDDHSRDTLVAVLKGRISGRRHYFQQCYAPNQYYPEDIIHFGNGEVLVELGSNDGGTLLEFLQRCPDYKSAYCFEPDLNCLRTIDKIAKNKHGGGTVCIIPKGAWDCKTVLDFSCENDNTVCGDAHILENSCGDAGMRIETDTVDAAVPEPVSFIKMDIEGAELQALHGAEQTIQRDRPKLAVCVYHKMEHFLDIWNYLRKLVPEYSFYLRHHCAYAGMDTVLYAVAADGRGAVPAAPEE